MTRRSLDTSEREACAPAPREQFHPLGTQQWMASQYAHEVTQAENPSIATREWRVALQGVVNEANYLLMHRGVSPDNLIEAIRRADVLLSRDARTLNETLNRRRRWPAEFDGAHHAT